MTLLAGRSLNASNFFKQGQPNANGSSFDLTIGTIFDDKGMEIKGPLTLEPGHIIQVVSAEVFDLPADITGHVTYKTTLTHKGIWALTVGIVDPGWKGPVATTLLNFSKVDYPLMEGDAFLRVSFFKHEPIELCELRQTPELSEYLKTIRKSACTLFSPTFLNSDAIAVRASSHVMNSIQKRALAWIAAIAVIFTIAQFIADYVSFSFTSTNEISRDNLSKDDIINLKNEITIIRKELETLKSYQSDSTYYTEQHEDAPKID